MNEKDGYAMSHLEDDSIPEYFVSEIYDAPQKKAIKNWNPDDQPREKLRDKGPRTLSNAELLAILIGSGTTEESAVDLMKRLMADCDDSLARLGRMDIDDLCSYKGVGEAKAIRILAASELGRRRREEDAYEYEDMSSAEAIYKYMLPRLQDNTVEEAWLLLLNNNFKLIRKPVQISIGGLTETSIDVRKVLKLALKNDATVIAICHNHPSNNPRPSRNDDNITDQLKKACSVMRIHLADHIVITDGDYYSYQENGKL